MPRSGRLIWLAEIAWRGLPQRHHHLVRHLQREWDILFIEPPASLRLPRVSITQIDGILVAQVLPIANTRTPRFRRALKRPWLRRICGRLAAGQVWFHVRRLGWQPDHRSDVVVCSNVYLVQAMNELCPRLKVLDLPDDPRYFPDEPPWLGELLIHAVRSADIVTTSSRTLLDEAVALGAARPCYVSNGVRQSLLETGRLSRRPSAGRVGYLGHIGPWLDFDLLEQLADALPDNMLELVGPVAFSEQRRLEHLMRRPNVRHEGAVSESAVADVLARFSVGIIPFRLTPLTRAVNPNKLYEYAAFDLPIVTTPFSPEVRALSDTIDVCSSIEEFVDVVRTRLAGGPRGSTRPIAEAHSWDAIGEQFSALLR